MPDFRSYAKIADYHPIDIVLSQEESHHLTRVNRAREGATVVVFNGEGREWICECTKADRSATRLKVHSHRKIPPLPYQITLAQALPKGKTMDSIVRKATELGVARILPLLSERTEVQLGEQRSVHKLGKWRTTAVEAAKQSGNSYLPELLPLCSIPDFLAATPQANLKLIASLQPGAVPLKSVLGPATQPDTSEPLRAIWMIGPEGDFTPAEIRAAQAAGFHPISLGPHTLRCETAAIYAISILNHELQHSHA